MSYFDEESAMFSIPQPPPITDWKEAMKSEPVELPGIPYDPGFTRAIGAAIGRSIDAAILETYAQEGTNAK
jgi:hypothetical protein